MSKRINRLNIETTATSTSTRHSSSAPLNSINIGGAGHPVPAANDKMDMNTSSDQISCSPDITPLNNVEGLHSQPNHLSNEAGNSQDFSLFQERLHTDFADANSGGVVMGDSNIPFKHNYPYPPNSPYYSPNQLLNTLFLERQLRRNNTQL